MKQRTIKKDRILQALRTDKKVNYQAIADRYDTSVGYVWSIAKSHEVERGYPEPTIQDDELVRVLNYPYKGDFPIEAALNNLTDVDATDFSSDPMSVAVQLFAAIAGGLWADDSRFHELLKEAPSDVKKEMAALPQATPELLEVLADDADPRVREYVARHTQDPDLLDSLIRDKDNSVIWQASVNWHLGSDTMQEIVAAEHPFAMTAILSNVNLPHDLAEKIADLEWRPLGTRSGTVEGDSWGSRVAAQYKSLTSEMVQKFLKADNPRVRIGLAANRHDYADKDVALEALSIDTHWQVRFEAFLNHRMPHVVKHRMFLAETEPLALIMMLNHDYLNLESEERNEIFADTLVQGLLGQAIRGELRALDLPNVDDRVMLDWLDYCDAQNKP